MARDNETTTKFKVDISELKKAMQDAKRAVAVANSEFKATAATMDDWRKSTDGLSAKLKQLDSNLSSQKTILSNLEQQYELTVKEMGEGSKAADNLKIKINNQKAVISKVQQEAAKYRAELVKLEKGSDGLGAEIKNLNTTLGSQKSELDKLENEYAEVVKEQGKGSKAAKDFETAISKQKAVINQTESELNQFEQALKEAKDEEEKAAKAAKELDDDLDNLGDSADGASGGFTVLKGAVAGFISGALSALVAGLGEAITALGSFGDAADKAMNHFQAATGASSSEMKEFDGVMKNIYNNNYGESFEDIANSMATVKQMAGDIGAAELEKMTTAALTLRDTFDMDVNESMRAAQSLMDQFGVSGEQAYNLIAQGAQNGLNQNGDLLDTVNEYSVQFKDAGYSAEEMFNMLNNGAESGTWSIDKLGDAVKEYNIRMTDGTANEYLEQLGLNADEVTAKYAKGGEAAQEVNEQVISALMGVEDEQQRYIIGQGIMGTMWEDLGEDAIKSLMSTKGEISNTKNALEEIGNVKYSSVGEALQGIGRNLQTGILLPISEKILPKMQELADKFKEWLADPATQSAIDSLSNSIGETLAGAIDVAASAFKWIIDNKDVLIGAFSGIAGGFAAFKGVGIVTSIIGGITKLIGIVKSAGGVFAALKIGIAAIGGPVTLVITIIGALVTAFITLWNTSDGFRNFWINLWENIKSACSTAADWIGQAINKIGAFFTETLPEFFNSCIEWIKSNWQSILLFLINPFAGLFNYFYENNTKFKEFVDNAVNFIKELPGKIWEWLVETINKIGEWITNMKEKATEAGKNFVENLVTFFKELPGKIGDFLYNALVTITGLLIAMGILAYQHGKEFVENLINFFKQLPGKVHTWLTNVISKVTTWASNMQKKARETAKKFVETVVKFIKELPGKVWTFLVNVVSKVTTWASNMKAKAKEAAQNFLNTVVNYIKQLPGKVQSFLTNVISKVTTWASNMLTKAKTAATNFVNAVVNLVKTLPGKIWTWLQNVVSKVATWGTNLYNKGREAAQKLFDAVVNKVKEIPGKMLSIGSDIVSGIWNGISNMTDWIKGKIKGFVGDVESWLKEFFGINSPSALMRDEVGVWLPAGIAEGMEANMGSMDSAMRTLGGYIVQGIIEYIKTMPEEMWLWLQNTTAKLVEWGTDLINKGKGIANDFIVEFTAKFSGLRAQMYSIGVNVMEGLRQGILSKKGELMATARAIAAEVNSTLKSSLDINSPSGVMRDEVGKWIPLGIAEGIKQYSGAALDAARQLATSIKEKANTGLNTEGIKDKIKEFFDTIKNHIVAIASKARNGLVIDSSFLSSAKNASVGDVVNNYYQTINSPKQLSRIEIYRQSKNLLNYSKG